jgi:hypothetical protein
MSTHAMLRHAGLSRISTPNTPLASILSPLLPFPLNHPAPPPVSSPGLASASLTMMTSGAVTRGEDRYCCTADRSACFVGQ